MKNKKKLIVAFMSLIISITILIVIINNKPKKKVENKTKDEVQIKEEVKEIKKLKIVDEDSDERNIAVMINNHPDARPQTGLSDAYIVYEIIVEGGLTRMMALYKGASTSVIGSVRSSRHYFLDYALENDAIYAHFGWSDRAQSDIYSLGVNNVNGLYDSGFWRERLNVAYEHTAFTSIDNIKEVALKRNYKLTSDNELLLNYSVDEVNLNNYSNVIEANNVDIPYSYSHTTSYKFDSDTNRYLRYVNEVPHKDRITDEQYSTKNIIIEKVRNYTIDNYGRQDLDNIGTGNGFYITNGYSIPINWEKKSRYSKTVYTDLDGNEIKVNDGNTYIQIEPINFEPNFY